MKSTDTVTTFVDELVAAMLNCRIYQHNHPRVQRSIDQLCTNLRLLEDELNAASFRLTAVDDMLVFAQRPLLGASIASARLIDALRALCSGGFEIRRGATREDLVALLDALVGRHGPDADWATVNTALQAAQCMLVELLAADVDDEVADRLGDRLAGDLEVPVRFYQALIDVLQNVTVEVCHGGTIDFGPVQAHAEEVLRRLETDELPVMNLARQEQYDAFTFGHSVRVAVLALNFARTLTNDRNLLIRIGCAALLHDVGKSLIPFEILHSNTVLDEEQRREMNRHPELGAQALLDHRDADPLSVAAAFGHHKIGDKGGYPRTEHVHELSLVTEIVKLCDVYEALTAARPYKRPMTPTKAYRVMIAMGDKFDRGLLKRFIEINGVYPNGQLVELSSGQHGRVVQQGSEMLKPVVQVVRSAAGELLPESDRSQIDLGADPEGRRIEGLARDEPI
jgi:HD-GYP domain-containing protein (c-di-GMP phosphodiesterase class II)